MWYGGAETKEMKVSDDLKRHVEFMPGFDKRSSNAATDFGISGGRFVFVVSGQGGAVFFTLHAGFYPRSAIDHLIRHYKNTWK